MRRAFAGCAGRGSAQLSSSSPVPFVEADGGWGMFSGWLFNHHSITGQTRQPAESSCERLILAAYRQWGDEFPKRLAGEYAFAIWDEARWRLLLGRDSTGQRTLYYALRHGQLHFWTDPAKSLTFAGSNAQPDEAHVARWLALQPCQTDSTFIAGIRVLPPGHTLVFEGGQIRTANLFDFKSIPELRLRDSREYAEGLLSVLQQAVNDRIDAAGNTGVFLSGGLDSSSVTALAARYLASGDRRLPAFTAVPATSIEHPGRFSDEGSHASSVAALYPNVDHMLIQSRPGTLFSILDRVSAGGNEPALNPANGMWIHEICRRAKQIGVDTLLIGSAGNLTISYNGQLALPSLLLRARFAAAARLAFEMRQTAELPWRSIANQAIGPLLPLRLAGVLTRLRSGEGIPDPLFFVRSEFARSHEIDELTAARYAHMWDSRTLRARTLARLDLGVPGEAYYHATGVQRSDPTFDQRVVEFCFSIPPERFCEGGMERFLIRNAMKGKISETVRTEKRRGLQASDFLCHLRNEMPEILSEVARARASELVSRILNVSRMEEAAQWPDERISEFGWGLYAGSLMRAFSLARYLRRLEEGSLAAPTEPASAQTA